MKPRNHILTLLLLVLAAAPAAAQPRLGADASVAVVLKRVDDMGAVTRGGQTIRFTQTTRLQAGGDTMRGRAAVDMLAPGMLVRLVETRVLAGGVVLVTRMEVMPQ